MKYVILFDFYIIYYFDIIAIDLTHLNNILISLFYLSDSTHVRVADE